MSTTNKDKPFAIGEVIEYCGEQHEVVENYGSSGRVKYVGDTSGDTWSYHWEAYGEECKRVVDTTSPQSLPNGL